MDIFGRDFESTNGYQSLWPILGVPILAVIPLVRHLAQIERLAPGGGGGELEWDGESRGRPRPKPQSWSA